MDTQTHATTSTAVRPFHINVPQKDLDELRQRLAMKRWPSKELVADRSQGVQLATAQALARYWALMIKKAVEEWYPKAEKLVLVMDNLNTHTIGSLYATFSPQEAERLSQKLEIHDTPKHTSWLNMAEIELSVLARQCLDQCLGNQQKLEQEVTGWQEARKQAPAPINWRFSTANARIKLKRLYPPVK